MEEEGTSGRGGARCQQTQSAGTDASRAPAAFFLWPGQGTVCTGHVLPSPPQTCELLLRFTDGPAGRWVVHSGQVSGAQRAGEEDGWEDGARRHRRDSNRLPSLAAEPLPLMDLCRRSIRLALGRQRLQDIGSLPLPPALKSYLQYQ